MPDHQDLDKKSKISSERADLYNKDLLGRAEAQVRENEDASLQDGSYSFDEDNTDNDDFHDVGDCSFDGLDESDYDVNED